MTTTAAPLLTRPASARGTGLAWNTWRQQRLTFIILAIGFAGCAIWLSVHGLRAHAAHAQFLRLHCLDHGSFECGRLQSELWGHAAFVNALPWLIGIFIGAPLAARDFETGSYRFSYAQGVGGRRQLAVKLLVTGIIVIVGCSLIGLLANWSSSPLHLIGRGPDTGLSYWQSSYFGGTAVTLPAFALLDLCLGAAAGALIRRTAPAIAVSAGVVLILAALSTGWGATGYGDEAYGPVMRAFLRIDVAARQAVPPPVNTVRDSADVAMLQRRGLLSAALVPPGQVTEYVMPLNDSAGVAGSLEVTSWFTGPGHHRLSAVAAQDVLNRIPPSVAASPAEVRSWFRARGIRYWIGYQPASRYWLFQAAIAAILVALALLCGAAAVATASTAGASSVVPELLWPLRIWQQRRP